MPQYPYQAYYTSTVSNGFANNAAVWNTWTGTSAQTITATATTPSYYYGTGYQTNANIWGTWQTTTGYRVVSDPGYVRPVLSAAEKLRQKRESMIARNQQRARMLRARVQARKAASTAEELLLDNLTDDQAAEYRRFQRFHLVVGERTYRIRKGMHGNIDLIDTERKVITERLCVYARGGVPAQDNMLAQKLMLETDEAALRRVANITPMHRAA